MITEERWNPLTELDNRFVKAHPLGVMRRHRIGGFDWKVVPEVTQVSVPQMYICSSLMFSFRYYKFPGCNVLLARYYIAERSGLSWPICCSRCGRMVASFFEVILRVKCVKECLIVLIVAQANIR